MRAILVAVALLAAPARGGCGGSQPTAPRDACAGKSCGAACAYCPPGTPADRCPAGACDAHRQCAAASSFVCTAAACAGKACGVRCDAPCPFGAPCPSPVVCDGNGACVPEQSAPCGAPGPGGCLGQACGAYCALPSPPGATATIATACNGNQSCEPPRPWDRCYDPCAGKACGVTCGLCPPGAGDCVETAELKRCDVNGRCVSSTPSLACPG